MNIKTRINNLESRIKPTEYKLYDWWGNEVSDVPPGAQVKTSDYLYVRIIEKDGIQTTELPEGIYYRAKELIKVTYEVIYPEGKNEHINANIEARNGVKA